MHLSSALAVPGACRTSRSRCPDLRTRMKSANARWAARFVKDLAALEVRERLSTPMPTTAAFTMLRAVPRFVAGILQAIVEATLSGRVESLLGCARPWSSRRKAYGAGVDGRSSSAGLRDAPAIRAAVASHEGTAGGRADGCRRVADPDRYRQTGDALERLPLHPHRPGDPLSNRRHSRLERRACQPFLLRLVEVLSPTTVVAIGRDAEIALGELNVAATTVRHPSYGGQPEFLKGLAKLYCISLKAPPRPPCGTTFR